MAQPDARGRSSKPAPGTHASPAPEPPPEPPAWLNLSDGAATIWTQLAASLPAGTITPADLWPFAMWCTALDTYDEMNRVITETGLLVAGGFGNDLIPNPAVPLRTQAARDAAGWAAYFKAAPKDRRAPGLPQAPEQPGPTPTPGGFPRLVQPT